MSMSGYSMSLLRACGVNNEQRLQVLAPIGGRLPQNDQEFHQVQAYLRRMGHILEAFPYSVANAMGRPAAPHHPTFYGESVDPQKQGWGAAGAGSPYSNVWNDGSAGAGSQSPPGQRVHQATGEDSGPERDASRVSANSWTSPLNASVLSAPLGDASSIL